MSICIWTKKIGYHTLTIESSRFGCYSTGLAPYGSEYECTKDIWPQIKAVVKLLNSGVYTGINQTDFCREILG